LNLREITKQLSESSIHSMVNVSCDSLNSPVTRTEIETAVHRLKLRKAMGVDNIPAECLKNPVCVDLLFKIITQCFNSGEVPDVWLHSIINPILKPDSDPHDPKTYRGISLISIPCKVYCDVINARLSEWCEKNDILAEEQNGFRKKRSCLEHIYSLCSVIKNRKNAKQSTYCCFIDMKKAFDNINRDCLWFKMQRLGITGRLYNAVKSLYRDVKYTVRVNGHLTPWFGASRGVKQGCLISPLLFSLYVNDLAESIKDLNCGVDIGDSNLSILLYADDIVLIAPTEDELQTMLNHVDSWCFKWRLSINENKTKVLHFRPKSTPRSQTCFSIGSTNIEYSSNYKYLGLWLNEHLFQIL